MTRKLFLLITGLLLVSCSSSEQEADTSRLDARIVRIENGLRPNLQINGREHEIYNIEERLHELNIPGVSVAFAENGEVSWSRAYGLANIGDDRLMDVNTLLLAGSISKPVSALRALQLVEDEVFDLDKNVNQYLTSWQVPDNEYTEIEKVTLRRILNHTAGLTVRGFPGYDVGDEIPTVVEVLDGLGNTDPVRVYKEPGESWQYSGGGYTIMQLAITDQLGVSFPETMQNNVLDRMSMPNSTFKNPLPSSRLPDAAVGYRSNGDEVEGKRPIYPEMAAAGLWTTPSELIQYAIEIQRIMRTSKGGVLRPVTVDEMLTPGMNGHGLGPGIGEHTFGHGGADEGFRARLVAWKGYPVAAVVMVNSDNGSIIQEVLLAIADEYELPGVEPTIRELAEMSATELKKFVGRYDLDDYGPLEILVSDDHLVVESDDFDEPLTLLPQGPMQFFDIPDGDIWEFDYDGQNVIGFTVNGLQGNKVD
jgi:CubicO group peptidase (beta-lactamase class C family)